MHKREKHRVAYIIDEIVGHTAGTENQLLTLIRGLSSTNFEPTLIVLRNSFYLSKRAVGCPVHVLNLTSLSRLSTIRTGFQLASHLRENDISVAQIFLNDAALFAPVFCKMAGARVILSRRDLGFLYTRIYRALININKLFVDRIVTNCDAVRNMLVEDEKWPKDRIEVIYNGHDMQRFTAPLVPGLRAEMDIPPDAPMIGIVANLNPWKRHTDLLEAFVHVRETCRTAHLIIAGEGQCMPALRRQASKLGLERCTHFLGLVEDPIPVIKECSLGILCSETEGLSNAVIEYMGCGKPVVASAVGGNAELVEDGITGYLVPVGDMKALADRIIMILRNAELGERMGVKGAARVREDFNLERMIGAHISMYHGLL